jgi:hypothetical protein
MENDRGQQHESVSASHPEIAFHVASLSDIHLEINSVLTPIETPETHSLAEVPKENQHLMFGCFLSAIFKASFRHRPFLSCLSVSR